MIKMESAIVNMNMKVQNVDNVSMDITHHLMGNVLVSTGVHSNAIFQLMQIPEKTDLLFTQGCSALYQ